MQDNPQSRSTSDKARFDFTYFRPVGRIALIFFVGLSFYLFVSTITLLLLTKPDREVKVPDVVGKQFVDVCNGLVRKGLKPEVRFQDVYDITSGTILNQYPEGGEIVYEGGALKLLVSRSALYVDVPNLTGIELPFAVNKLRNLHSHNRSVSLAIGATTYIPSDKTAENIVLDQSPKAGEKVTPDRRVNILVSAGKIEGDMLMPDVTGQSIDLCLDLLLSKAFGRGGGRGDGASRAQRPVWKARSLRRRPLYSGRRRPPEGVIPCRGSNCTGVRARSARCLEK